MNSHDPYPKRLIEVDLPIKRISEFTPRQALALATIVRSVREAGKKVAMEQDTGFTAAVQTCLALAVDRQADHTNSGCTWNSSGPKLQHLYTRQALPIIWDFAEAQPFGDSVGDWSHAIECILIALDAASHFSNSGYVESSLATKHSLPNQAASCFFTDPPYYDSVSYADLADFFYVWLRRTVGDCYPNLFEKQLTSKKEQAIVWHPNSVEEKQEFERKMKQAMAEGCRILSPSGIGVVVFAHKSTTGWEAQVQAMIEAGWIITGSWPIDT